MRKQYHFRPSSNGYHAWDVDRLFDFSKDLVGKPVSLQSIRELDENYWFGDEDEPTCRAVIEHARLIDEADLSPPIILSAGGRIMDGMHRVGKAILKGHKTITAVRFENDPEPDFKDVAPDELSY